MKDGRIIRSSGVVGSFTLLSRGLGMVRDVLIAYFFGTSLVASAFFVAFTLPNLFRRLFGEGALSAAFIPVLIETRKKDGEKAAWSMASKVITMTAALLSAIAIVGVLLFSVMLRIPDLPEKWLLPLTLSRIMFPYLLFICLAALSMAVLNSYKHFSTSAFAPSMLNLILIGTMLAVFPLLGDQPALWIRALSWSVLLAGVAQVAIQLPALKRFGCPFRFASHWRDPRINQILRLMGPAALGMAVTQFNVLIDRFLALWIGEWAPAALSYSERLIYFPLGVIATAMATVLLPTFSTHVADKDHEAMRNTISDSLKYLLFILVPASFGLLALAPAILQTVFSWGGEFSTDSTLLSARALRFYAPGLVIFSLAKVFVPAFYSLKDTRTPVAIAIGTVILNLTLNIILILTLPTYWKHAGMAFSTVLAEAVGMLAMGILLSHRVKKIDWRSIFTTFALTFLASAVMASAAWFIAKTTAFHTGFLPDKLSQITSVSLAIFSGILLYLLMALLLRMPELHSIRAALLKQNK